MDPQEELVRLLILQLRRTAKSQSEFVRELAKAGFTPKRIAELVGTTPNTVSQALSEAKRQGAEPSRSPRKQPAQRGGTTR
jgi:predicted transcriptional regulator